MKKITVRSKKSCWYFHDWRFTHSTGSIDYYHCPFCLSRRAVIHDNIRGYQPVNMEWLNVSKHLIPFVDSHWLVRKFRYLVIGTALFFILIGISGMANTFFDLEPCDSATERRTLSGECMVRMRNGAWVNRDILK